MDRVGVGVGNGGMNAGEGQKGFLSTIEIHTDGFFVMIKSHLHLSRRVGK